MKNLKKLGKTLNKAELKKVFGGTETFKRPDDDGVNEGGGATGGGMGSNDFCVYCPGNSTQNCDPAVVAAYC